MTEILIAVGVFSLACLGLGLGLALGRAPVRTSCGAAACLPGGGCADCPSRRRAAAGESGQ